LFDNAQARRLLCQYLYKNHPGKIMPRSKITLKARTEAFFGFWSEAVVRYRWWVLLTVVVVTGSILPQLRHVTIDVSIESFLSRNDPAITKYDAYREQFGYDIVGLITIETPGDVFTLENLQRLQLLHKDLESSVPHLSEITSLYNVRRTIGSDDTLVVEELGDIWPQSEEELPAFRQLVLSNPAYLGSLVSANGRLTNIVLELNSYTSTTQAMGTEAALDQLEAAFDEPDKTIAVKKPGRNEYLTPDEEADFVSTLMAVSARHQAPGFHLYNGGVPVVNYSMAEDMGEAMMRNMGIGLALIAFLLYLLFRRLSGVLMPLLAVWLSMMMTIAMMPLLGFAVNGHTQILPTFLLAVGIADAVHIQSVFYRLYDRGMEKHAAIVAAMKNTAVAVVMTSLTTAVSLLSFIAADLLPVKSLGIFGAIGVVLALYYTIALIPALLAILPVRRRVIIEKVDGVNQAQGETRILKLLDKVIYTLGDFGVRHAKGVLIFTLFCAVFAIVGLFKVQFSHDALRWYNETHPIRVASELVDTEMSGTQSMQVVFDTHQENGLYEPAFLKLLDESEDYIENLRVNTTGARQAISILSVVKETHKALNNGDEAFYAIPPTREAVAQELFLFENGGADDIADFTDSTFRLARISVMLPWTNAIGYQEYVETLDAGLEALIEKHGLENVSVKTTGVMAIFGNTLQALLSSTMKSYALAFVMVGLLMCLLMGSVRRGALALIPNIMPIMLTLGMMGWFNLPLNMLTSILGCIMIGIAVDDTIHFMHHFRKYATSEPNTRIAVHQALESVGRALVFTSIVLVGGFIVHVFGEFHSSRHFGILLSFAIIMALLANLVLAPALMALFWKSEAGTASANQSKE
jgi:hypothetical protein